MFRPSPSFLMMTSLWLGCFLRTSSEPGSVPCGERTALSLKGPVQPRRVEPKDNGLGWPQLCHFFKLTFPPSQTYTLIPTPPHRLCDLELAWPLQALLHLPLAGLAVSASAGPWGDWPQRGARARSATPCRYKRRFLVGKRIVVLQPVRQHS